MNRANYATYDQNKTRSTLGRSPTLSREDSLDSDGAAPHPYWYTRVIGIFHANDQHAGPQYKSSLLRRMYFLWVRWFGQDSHSLRQCGWKARRLLRGIPRWGETSRVRVFGPCTGYPLSISGTCFCARSSIAGQPSEGDEGWAFYYVNV